MQAWSDAVKACLDDMSISELESDCDYFGLVASKF